MIKIKVIFGFLIIGLLLSANICNNSYSHAATVAQESVVLTIDTSTKKAIDRTNKIVEFDKSLEDLWKQENEFMNLRNTIQRQLDGLDKYRALYKKRESHVTFNLDEQNEFFSFQYMYGNRPPEYSGEELFNNYIKNRDFPHYSTWAAYQNMKTSKELTISSITLAIQQLYSQLIALYDNRSLLENQIKIMIKQNESSTAKFKAGQISSNEKYLSDVAIQQQKLSLDKLNRTINNLEMTFKQQIGLPLTQKISLQPTNAIIEIKESTEYQKYLDTALSARAEIVTSKMILQVKQRELDIMSQYITNELLTDRMEAQQAVEDTTITYNEAVNNVKKDIYEGYSDMIMKRSQINIAKKKKENAEKQYNTTLSQYNKGVTSLSNLLNIENERTQAIIGYKTALQDHNNALYRLELASGVGPGYSSN